MTKSKLFSSIRRLFNHYGGGTHLEAKLFAELNEYIASRDVSDVSEGSPTVLPTVTLHETPQSELVELLAKHFDTIGEPDPNVEQVIVQPRGHLTVSLDGENNYYLMQGMRAATVTRESLQAYRRTVMYDHLVTSYTLAAQDMKAQDDRLYKFILDEIKPFLAEGNYRQAMLHVVKLKLVNCDPTRRAVGHIFEQALKAGAEGYAQLLDIEIPVARASMDTLGAHNEPK